VVQAVAGLAIVAIAGVEIAQLADQVHTGVSTLGVGVFCSALGGALLFASAFVRFSSSA
jgi:hypothetical protein